MSQKLCNPSSDVTKLCNFPLMTSPIFSHVTKNLFFLLVTSLYRSKSSGDLPEQYICLQKTSLLRINLFKKNLSSNFLQIKVIQLKKMNGLKLLKQIKDGILSHFTILTGACTIILFSYCACTG